MHSAINITFVVFELNFWHWSLIFTLDQNELKEDFVTCHECGMDFFEQASLEQHMRIHTEEKLFICPQCGKSFTVKYRLEAHLRIQHWRKTIQLLRFVESVSWNKVRLKDTWEVTLERNLSLALNVKKVSHRNKALTVTLEFTPERNLSPALIVERASQH